MNKNFSFSFTFSLAERDFCKKFDENFETLILIRYEPVLTLGAMLGSTQKLPLAGSAVSMFIGGQHDE